jgi:hypothetical protein
MTIHGTALRLPAGGLLLVGPSGSGKSSLALRLIDRGAMLVADDRVVLESDGPRPVARPPAALAGLIEVRGLGVLRVPHAERTALDLVLDLGRPAERLPAPACWTSDRATLPLLGFEPHRPDAALCAEWAVALAAANRLWSADGV